MGATRSSRVAILISAAGAIGCALANEPRPTGKPSLQDASPTQLREEAPVSCDRVHAGRGHASVMGPAVGTLAREGHALVTSAPWLGRGVIEAHGHELQRHHSPRRSLWWRHRRRGRPAGGAGLRRRFRSRSGRGYVRSRRRGLLRGSVRGNAITDIGANRSDVNRDRGDRHQPCRLTPRGVHGRHSRGLAAGSPRPAADRPLRRLHTLLGDIGLHDRHRHHRDPGADASVHRCAGGLRWSARNDPRVAKRDRRSQRPRTRGRPHHGDCRGSLAETAAGAHAARPGGAHRRNIAQSRVVDRDTGDRRDPHRASRGPAAGALPRRPRGVAAAGTDHRPARLDRQSPDLAHR